MKKSIAFVAIFFCITTLSKVFAQQSTVPPTFQDLMRWANNLPYSTVHRELKKQGFLFIRQEDIEQGRRYTYQRVTDTHTQTMGVCSKNSNVYLIAFITTVIDLSNYYGTNIEKVAKSIDCPPSDDSNTTSFCYNNKNYYFQVSEGIYFGKVTSYSITISKY